MPRTPRSHLPGAVFHLTARTQGHVGWFTPEVRSRIAEYVASTMAVSDASLLAWAIMPNHLHLVVRQGAWTLGRVMHPLLHRVAILVQRTHGVEGHVFERRFADVACTDPDHVRNAIVYSHLNPVRARLANGPEGYPWSSHAMYASTGGGPSCMHGVLRVESSLELFADREMSAQAELRQAYLRYVQWRLDDDRRRAENPADSGADAATPPAVSIGGLRWWRGSADLFASHRLADNLGISPPRGDLGQVAKKTLAALGADVPLERVRSGCKARPVVRARRAVIRRMGEAGYTGVAIARYLRVSPQCVSNVLTRYRPCRDP